MISVHDIYTVTGEVQGIEFNPGRGELYMDVLETGKTYALPLMILSRDPGSKLSVNGRSVTSAGLLAALYDMADGVKPQVTAHRERDHYGAILKAEFTIGAPQLAARDVPLPQTTDDLFAGLTDGIDACQHWPASRFVPTTAVTVMKALADVLAKPENAAVAQDVVDTANRPKAA